MTPFEAMRTGAPYDAGDPQLVTMRKTAQRLMRDYNATIYGDEDRGAILTDLLGTWSGAVIRPPFHVDYGRNIHFSARAAS
jgi:maltose O-acetyltransferase